MFNKFLYDIRPLPLIPVSILLMLDGTGTLRIHILSLLESYINIKISSLMKTL